MARPKSNAGIYASEVATLMRGNFLEALAKIRHRRNITNSDIFVEWIEKDGLGPVIDRVAKFMPKELNIDQNITLGIEQLLADLPKAIEARQQQAAVAAPETTYELVSDDSNGIAPDQAQTAAVESVRKPEHDAVDTDKNS